MLAPKLGVALRESNVEQPPHRLTLPPELDTPTAAYWGLFKICVGTTGEVARVDVVKSTGDKERLDARWSAAMRTWRYKPHQVNGRATPFCHPIRVEIRNAAAAAPDAGAPNEPVTVAPRIGVGQRLTDPTKPPYKPTLPADLNKVGAVYWGLFKICVAATGEVTHVNVIRSTEAAGLDQRWIATMKTWRYRPYSVDGKPVPFCHPVRLQVKAMY